MSIVYNKNTENKQPKSIQNHVQKPNGMLFDYLDTIEGLKAEIKSLKEGKGLSQNLFTAEQVDIEINKAVKNVTMELKDKLSIESRVIDDLQQACNTLKLEIEYKDKLTSNIRTEYETVIETLNYKIEKIELENEHYKKLVADKEYLINQLKNQIDSNPHNSSIDIENLLSKIENMIQSGGEKSTTSERPEIEETIIDPHDNSVNNVAETNIKIETMVLNKEEAIDSKVDKLRNLFKNKST